jgi:hypothetical protein
MTGFHENLSREEAVAGPSNRSFGLTFAVVFLLIGGLLAWRGHGWGYGVVVAGVGFAVVAFAAPRLLTPLNRVWLRVGLALHHVVNPVIMGALFYLTITPVGVVMRLAGKDFLRLKFDPGASTYWIERRPPGPKPDTMRNQF